MGVHHDAVSPGLDKIKRSLGDVDSIRLFHRVEMCFRNTGQTYRTNSLSATRSPDICIALYNLDSLKSSTYSFQLLSSNMS